MKIRLKRSIANNYGRFGKGDEVDWHPRDSMPLVELGFAEIVDDVAAAPVAVFASKGAEELASGHWLGLEPGAGEGKDGAYTIADIREMIAFMGEEEV